MYACICHAVPDTAILRAASAGASAEEVAQLTGAGTSCGRCSEVVAALIARPNRCERTGGACSGCRDHHRS